ncbi:MAG: hypothetical protein WAK97_01650, partial [Pseudolabrys sp.]
WLWNITRADAGQALHGPSTLVGTVVPAVGAEGRKIQNSFGLACAKFGTFNKLSPTKRVVHSLFCVTVATILYI